MALKLPLRSQHDELNIPIIALTADVTTIDADKARAVGMNDYISKPIDEQLLYSKILTFSNQNEQI
jgi:CheY-like chemotaxis protein